MLDDRQLRADLLGKLRRVVGFDAYAFLLTDPQTAVGSSPLADVPVPLLGALPRLIRAKYLTAANRWTALDPGQVALLSTVGDGDPLRPALRARRAARIGTGIAVTIEESAPAERLGLFTRASALPAARYGRS